jgi:hypothetical protein
MPKALAFIRVPEFTVVQFALAPPEASLPNS